MSALKRLYKIVFTLVLTIITLTGWSQTQGNSGNDCDIIEFSISDFNCNPGNTYNATINFSVINPTQLLFEVWVNGDYYGLFELSQLPLNLENIVPVNGSEFDFIQVCINDNPNCCAVVEYLQPECLGNNCEIGQIIAEATDCVDGFFFIHLDFDYTNVSDDFSVIGNGNNYGIFGYGELPITLGPFDGMNPVDLEFLVIDGSNPDCTNSINFGTYECNGADCEITGLGIEFGECDGDTYSGWIFFEVINTTQEFFDVWINGEFIGFYELGSLPLLIDGIIPQNGSIYDYIEVCINDNPNCCATIEYLQPECLGGDCEIGNVIVEPYECVDGFFFVDLTFEFTGVSENFTVMGNGNNYGTYNYNNLPITLGPFNGLDPIFLEFVVTDNQNPDCSNFSDFGFYYCDIGDCGIENLVIDVTGCNEGGTYNMYFNFEVINAGNDYFDYSINNGDIEGFALISSLPFYIDSITPRNFSEYDIIEVCVNDNPNCCSVLEYMQPECLTSIHENSTFDFKVILDNSFAHVSFSNVRNHELEISLYDMLGRTHYKQKVFNKQSVSIDLNDIASGAYIVNVTENNQSYLKKLVITR